ncbi:uncharacterized protein [Physcomitrium patens]|uniref:B box-type domain-containing protein n=1 Tax=Physcomitrium patens TaxID=3218 RepID=A0A2K1L3M0_PHYPA|nr:putative zinc finger protein CONSTANS-LIKE 11 [Physcomitrium patens]PNR60624.1 hypothetical protein PHYPA_003417 [Physcomitrium patens]|eukprot:XP_024399245.1 putative zinc finger protein CONSTANS-LIKE 11 [Physcomitrella patens]
MARTNTACELCDGVAALYCEADEAHICWICDAKVHSANFLVARHTRSVLCGTCGTQTSWRASGANPTPLPGVCAECSQGEAQGECITLNDGNVIDTARVTAESCESAVIFETEFSQVSSCESSHSQLSSYDSEGVIVDCGSAHASVSSGISKSLKRKRSLHSLLPVSVPQSKQIAMRVLEDVNSSDAHRQCKCDSTTSSSSSTGSNSRANQDSSFEERGDNRTQFPEFGNTNRVVTNHLLSSAKRQRMDDRVQTMSSFAPAQESAVLSISRSMRTLAKWHWDLHLSSPGTVPLALRMFCKVSRALTPTLFSNSGRRVALAACLRLAAVLDEAQITVPNSGKVAACAGVSARRLAMTELHLLALLGSRRLPVWASSRT